MKFAIDHDFHIHSYLSLCSNNPEQTTDAILKYALKNNLKKICLTDHFWDETIADDKIKEGWYGVQNYARLSSNLPLPQHRDVEFLFGAETEMDKFFNLGIAPADFKVITERLNLTQADKFSICK